MDCRSNQNRRRRLDVSIAFVVCGAFRKLAVGRIHIACFEAAQNSLKDGLCHGAPICRLSSEPLVSYRINRQLVELSSLLILRRARPKSRIA